MPVEKKEVEAMIKAEVAKITSRLDALEKKVDAHETTFNQRDEERKKKLEAMTQQLAASGKSGGVSPEEIKKAAGPQITELKTVMAKALEAQAKDKAVQAANAEMSKKVIEESNKRVAEMQAQMAKMQIESRLVVLESLVKGLGSR